MVYGGLINKSIVAKLQAYNANAIGLTGADANIISATKRPIKNEIDYGFVGDVEKVDGKIISSFIENKLIPVIAPLTHNGQGDILNTNADTVASTIATALSSLYSVHLVYCFELKGVLRDINDKDSVISDIDQTTYELLKNEGVIAKGMIPKMDNAFEAIQSGVKTVRICHADEILSISDNTKQIGTTLFSNKEISH
jgi:acetylglutamate kinase